MYWQSPTPTSFSHYHWTASMRAAAESAPIHAVINAMHKYLVLHTDYYDQSAVHSCSGSRLYRGMYRVPLSIQYMAMV